VIFEKSSKFDDFEILKSRSQKFFKFLKTSRDFLGPGTGLLQGF